VLAIAAGLCLCGHRRWRDRHYRAFGLDLLRLRDRKRPKIRWFIALFLSMIAGHYPWYGDADHSGLIRAEIDLLVTRAGETGAVQSKGGAPLSCF